MDVPNDAALPPMAVAVDPASAALAWFRRRGRLFFTFLAFWAVLLGGVVIVFGATDNPLRSVVVAIIGVAIGVAVDVALGFGLAERRPWANRATIVVCGIFLVAGVLRSLIKLSSGTVEIPLDAIGAALVLAVRPTMLAPDLPAIAAGSVLWPPPRWSPPSCRSSPMASRPERSLAPIPIRSPSS